MITIDNKYFIRDLTWLSFNYRVLEEAKNPDLPVYERLKFFAIYSSNLDEFYKVRVAGYRSLVDVPVNSRKKLAYNPEEVLKEMQDIISKQQKEFYKIFQHNLLPELRENKIILHQTEGKLGEEHQQFIKDYFYTEILPYVQPSLIVRGKIHSFLQDNAIYLAVKLYNKTRKTSKTKQNSKRRRIAKYALMRIPTHHIPRFIQLPKIDENYYIILLDDVIKYNLAFLFPGYEIDSSYSIKLSRDADLAIEDEFHGDLIQKIRKSLIRRKTGRPCRFLYDKDVPEGLLKVLISVFNLSQEDLVPGAKYHNRSDFFDFPNPLSPKLEIPPMPQLHIKSLDEYDSIFEAIKRKDWLMHYPYQTYDYVIDFFTQASVDPKVTEIKTTQYRVAKNSAIGNALINAARNGKKVTVFVEVKARFDEEMNLHWAEKMKKAGITVIPSIPGLKVHAKVGLVLRKSARKSKQRGYAFLSTGNFNEKTAKLYADHGFFTAKDDIIDELGHLFLHLEDQSYRYDFKTILVAQFNMVPEIIKKIDREIKNVKKGKKGYMILKMNGLEGNKIIDKLYEAGQAGVEIDLIVRGICCLIPNQEYSPNIRITRIVDQYLEHARVWVFYNNGENDTYIASADWMKRNLYRRIESGIPIRDKVLKKELIDILQIQLKDNTSARWIDEKMNNVCKACEPDEPKFRAQYDTYQYLKLLS